jgi:hypothetical protein
MSLLAMAGPAAEAAELAGRSGLSVLESSLLGAIAVLCLVVAIFAVWKLNKVQNERVEDQKQMSGRMEKLAEKLVSTFSETNNALSNLTQAEKDGQALMQQLKSSIDGVIMAAVRRGSSHPPRP